jgi:hypothetical protein
MLTIIGDAGEITLRNQYLRVGEIDIGLAKSFPGTYQAPNPKQLITASYYTVALGL